MDKIIRISNIIQPNKMVYGIKIIYIVFELHIHIIIYIVLMLFGI